MTHEKGNTKNKPFIISPRRHATPLTNQCDACSPIVFANVRESAPQDAIDNSRFSLADDIIEVPIGGDHFACLVSSNQAFSVLNREARNILSAFDTATPLGHVRQKWGRDKELPALLSKFHHAGLIRSEIEQDRCLKEVPDKLTAWLHLTDRCNLRCQYCYLPHKSVNMSADTGKAAIDATFRSALRNHYHAIKLKYAGGEPLLRLGLIRLLHEYALERAAEKKIALDEMLLSNGTLLSKENVKLIRSLHLRVMVSLDGIGAAHDVQRPFAGGTGSFEKTMNGIESLLEAGLLPDISVTVTGQNADRLADLTGWLLEGSLPFTFNLYRENKLSKSNHGLQFEDDRIIKGVKSAFELIERNLPQRSLLACLADQTNLSAPHLRACSVGHSYLVFDHLGQVSKCQMQIDKPVTSINAPDPLSLIRQDREGIQNLSVDDKTECSQCDWKYWCGGGCPLANYRASGSYDAKSPNCAIYKALFPEVMRLEALRLLKDYGLGN